MKYRILIGKNKGKVLEGTMNQDEVVTMKDGNKEIKLPLSLLIVDPELPKEQPKKQAAKKAAAKKTPAKKTTKNK